MTAYRIQDVIGPDYGRPEALFFRRGNVAGAMPWALAPGDEIDFDSYFNAFYPDVWEKHTAIGRVGVAVTTTGPVTVEIAAVGDDGARHVLLEKSVTGREVLWPTGAPKDGRLTLRVTGQGAAQLSDLGWVTDVPPLSVPTLSIGLCTFNREDLFTVTLEVLAQLQSRNPAIRHIWVANQGSTFTNPIIDQLAARDGITVIEQTNLGGCGGFTRTMLEAIEADSPASHHLVMDDDIVLDPRAVERTLTFLSYVEGELAVGGQMIDLDEPTLLREFGARLDRERFALPVGGDVELAETGALTLFHHMPEIDYNAWWFCVVPTAAIRRIGLPVPFFIRGDDIEYGCRLGREGVETISMPGVAVWHENFLHKTSDWLEYYYMRNRLFVAALHPGKVWRPVGYHLLAYVMVYLFQHRYRAADMAILAIEDVLAGADEALGADSESRHMALMKRLNRYQAYDEIAPEALPETREGRTAPLDTAVPAMIRMSVWGFFGQHLNVLLRRWKKPLRFPYVPMPNNIGANDYIVPKGLRGESYLLYRARLGPMWSVMLRALWVWLRYSLTPERYFRDLAEALEAKRRPANWRRLFGLPRGRF